MTAACEVTFTISCHTGSGLATLHGVAIAIATWTTRDRATPTPFMARGGRLQIIEFIFSLFFPFLIYINRCLS